MHVWQATAARVLPLAVLLGLYASPLVAADGKSRVHQMLTGRHEQVRLQAIGTLEQDASERERYLDDLILAVNELAEEAVEADSKGGGLPGSTIRAIQLLAGSPAPAPPRH